MGIFNRLTTLVKSNINDLIDKAEDPEKMLKQLIADMNEQYNEASKEVAAAIADEKKLERQYQEQISLSKKWEQRAELALKKNDEGLAVEALKRKKEYDDTASGYKSQWDAQRTSTQQLKSQLKELKDKIEEAKRKKDLLIARAKRADAQKNIQKTMSGLSDNSSFDVFDKMASKVDTKEAEAMAYTELNDEMNGDDLEKQFEDLEENDPDVMDELEQLKAKLNKEKAE